ncbi:MAG TPA: PAS domain S-box protein [Deltaproteobacteria bacterium]|nr:PAS domain S-box protein [Deltaproteobacteria bacterium]HPP79709.1 PAS domain S-box protein [Deltaproteobacteria bacterium]
MADERYRKILDDMQEGYYEIDLNGTFTFVNDVVASIAEIPKEELIGLNYIEYTSPATAKRVFKTFNKVFQTGIPQRIEYEIILRDNRKKIIENSVSLLKDSENNVIGFCGLVTDITKRKRLEEQIKESRQRFEALFENANELIITTDAQGYIKRLNKKVEEISGYRREELIGKSILVLAHPDDRLLYIDFWKQLLDGKTPRFELRGVGKNGDVAWLLASGSAIRKGGRIIEVQYNAQEITSLKNALLTIEDLKNHLSSIFESSPNMILCLNTEGRVVMANPITERIFHKPLSAVIGCHFSSLSPRMAQFEGVVKAVQASRLPQTLHEERIKEDGREIFDVIVYPLVGGKQGGVVFTAVDITEKKEMELQLVHAQKMETIGELAGGVAHDFNNIFTGITGNVSMLRFTTDEEKRQQYLKSLENITERARGLTRQILAFSKRNEGNPEVILVDSAVREVMDISTKSIPKNVRIEYTSSGKDLSVFMDHTHLVQVLLNLVVNAKDAIGSNQDGRISISVSPMLVDKESRRQYLLGSIGRHVRIEVADNGCGMDMSVLPKIFDPFFTTKQKGPNKGTGLGLSIAYNIIKNAGGSIQVSSTPGKGSTFTVLLPVAKARDKSKDHETRPMQTAARQSARILMVDDEDMLRDIGKDMLCMLGHSVTTATNGRECIDILKNDPDGFDLVILDMIMPELDGYHTLQQMKALGLSTRVIISSGFSFEHEKEDFLENPLIVARLNKPFNLEELSQVLDEALS